MLDIYERSLENDLDIHPWPECSLDTIYCCSLSYCTAVLNVLLYSHRALFYLHSPSRTREK